MVRAQPRGARVNYVTLADAQQSSEIVLGRLLVCSVPATVLFDSGASHSFISNAFAMSLDLPREQLPRPLQFVPRALEWSLPELFQMSRSVFRVLSFHHP